MGAKAFDFPEYVEKNVSMEAMIFLSFLIGYPVLMLLGYLLFRMMFPTNAEIERNHEMETKILLARARRMKRRERRRTTAMQPSPEPVFVLPKFRLDNR